MSIDESTSAQEKILVEVFMLSNVRAPVEELVKALSKSGRWAGRLDVRIVRNEGSTEAETPYGKFGENTVVVDGQHIIRGSNYWALSQALEDSATPMEI